MDMSRKRSVWQPLGLGSSDGHGLAIQESGCLSADPDEVANILILEAQRSCCLAGEKVLTALPKTSGAWLRRVPPELRATRQKRLAKSHSSGRIN